VRRLALFALVVIGVLAALEVASYVSAGTTSASATWNIGSGTYLLAGDGSCQTVGGDFSVSIANKGEYFHLLWTPNAHGGYRSVAWRWTYLTNDAVIGAKITFADGRKSGTFSGLSTKGVRVTGSFNCR
jgi:hypothetical protein